MQLQTIVNTLQLDLSVGDTTIRSLVYDSRQAKGTSDELFVALSGSKNNGHQFIPDLLQRGVRHFLVNEDHTDDGLHGAVFLKVKDPLAALQLLAATHRRQFQLPVIGITGSNGKTIVKEWLATILSKTKNVVKSPKSYNSQLGVALSLWSITKNHEIGIFEAGVSEKGEMVNLASMIHPTLGIFTNIGEAHSDGFASQKEKIEEKALLFTNAERVIVRKRHVEICRILEKQQIKVICWGVDDPEADINFQTNTDGYVLSHGNQKIKLTTRWSNPYDLENLFHAVSAALLLGFDEKDLIAGIAKLKPIPMRLTLKRGAHQTYVLDDTYNNDLKGLEVALEYLRQHPRQHKKSVILSDLLQTGKSRTALYQEVNQLLADHEISQLFGIGPQICQSADLFSIPFRGFDSVPQFLNQSPAFSNELILVKGAREFGLERIVSYLEEKSHGTILEVNFEALTHNLKTYQKLIKSPVKMMVMVKAFAYGVGVEEIAHLLQYHQVDYLGVAYLDEAIQLRKNDINLPIMIMNVDWNHFGLLESFQLEPEIYSMDMLKSYAASTTNPSPIHIKIETGMNRLGFEVSQLDELCQFLKSNGDIRVAGIFTHFSSADDPNNDAFTDQQALVFEQAYQKISEHIGYKPIKHAVNSVGMVRFPQYHFDMVRLGIGLYGYDSSRSDLGLRPISVLKSKVSQIRHIKKGESIGYSRAGTTTRDSEIATISIGYADGFSRVYGNGKAYVTINGQKAPTIGNICMDMTMIDVTGLQVKVGDEVTIFGDDPTIKQLADWANTIPYEILTSVSQRVKRVFVSE